MKNAIIKFSALIVLVILFGCSSGVQSLQQEEKPAKSDYYVAAYIWPSCHDDSLGREKLWPEGTGEWEVINKGNPRFDGHYQPRQPLWGYELDNDPKVVEKWIDVATDHGVNVFVYDWYWYDEGPYLESALNDGFLKARNNEKMKFYIMWANHDVKYNYWNYHRYKDNTDILWNAKVDWKNYQIIVDRVINQYFKRPNYFKINGEPVFSIFSVKAMGFNSVAMYNMGGRVEDYIAYGTNSIKIREQMDAILDVPVFPCVSIGWDDTPRFPAKGIHDVVHYHNTPQSFATLLAKAKKYADSHPEQPKLITINAWNEWVEGSYMLPDMLNGFGYLEAVKEVIIDGKYDRY